MKTNTITSRLVLYTLLGLLACARDRDGDQPDSARKPAPFDAGPVPIALVQNSGAGDYFQQWTDGARQQANAAGFKMQIYDAKADPARQASDMKTAIESGVKGIIVDHGLAGTMCPLLQQATDAGIAVVVYDIEITECAPGAVETAQDDADLATLVLTQMAQELGDGIPVGMSTCLASLRSTGAMLCGRSLWRNTSGRQSSSSASSPTPWPATTRGSSMPR